VAEKSELRDDVELMERSVDVRIWAERLRGVPGVPGRESGIAVAGDAIEVSRDCVWSDSMDWCKLSCVELVGSGDDVFGFLYPVAKPCLS